MTKADTSAASFTSTVLARLCCLAGKSHSDTGPAPSSSRPRSSCSRPGCDPTPRQLQLNYPDPDLQFGIAFRHGSLPPRFHHIPHRSTLLYRRPAALPHRRRQISHWPSLWYQRIQFCSIYRCRPSRKDAPVSSRQSRHGQDRVSLFDQS